MGALGPKMLACVGKTALALAMVAWIGMPAPAAAQGTVRSVHNDWQVRCDTPPGAQSEHCALIQSVTAEDRANVGLTVLILKNAAQKAKPFEIKQVSQ